MKDLQIAKAKIETCTADLENQLEEARQKLARLQDESPKCLANFYLGELTKEEVNDHKARIAELQSFIGDAEQAIQGLAVLSDECRQGMAQEAREQAGRKAQAYYEELKVKSALLGDPRTYDRWLESSFRSAAHAVGKQTEASALLHELQRQRDNRARVAEPATCQPVN